MSHSSTSDSADRLVFKAQRAVWSRALDQLIYQARVLQQWYLEAELIRLQKSIDDYEILEEN